MKIVTEQILMNLNLTAYILYTHTHLIIYFNRNTCTPTHSCRYLFMWQQHSAKTYRLQVKLQVIQVHIKPQNERYLCEYDRGMDVKKTVLSIEMANR